MVTEERPHHIVHSQLNFAVLAHLIRLLCGDHFNSQLG